MRVVEEAAAPGDLEAGSAAQFSDPHRHKSFPAAVALKEIEEGSELCRRVGSRGNFNEAGA